MTNDDKRKSAQTEASKTQECEQVLTPPERIDATVDELLGKLFNTTPEQIEEWEEGLEENANNLHSS